MLNLTIIMSALIFMGDIDYSNLNLETLVDLNNLKEIGERLKNDRSMSEDWFGEPLNFLNGTKIGEKYKVIKISINDDIPNILGLTDPNTIVTQQSTTPQPQGILDRTKDFFKSFLKKIPSPSEVVQSVLEVFQGNNTISTNTISQEELDSMNDYNDVNKTNDKNDEIISEDKLSENVGGENNDKPKIGKVKSFQIVDENSNIEEIQDILESPYDKLTNNDGSNANKLLSYTLENKDDKKDNDGKDDKDDKDVKEDKDDKEDKDPATRIIGGSPSLKYTPIRNKFRGDIGW